MSALIHIKDGEPVTTSLAIAEGTTNTHEAVIKLVRAYKTDLEKFGLVRFEIRPRPEGQHGGADVEYALLNEQQSALVIAYMRNSEIVRQFKIALIKGFFDMRAQLSAQNSLAELPPEQRALVALMVDNARIKAQQQEIVATQESHTESIKRLEVKQSAFEDGASYFTVIGYGAMHGIKIDHATAIRVGRRAGELSKRQCIPIGKVRDVRFGQVNSYHESMLDAAFIEMGDAK